MKSKNILTLLICAGLGLSLAAPLAMADNAPATSTPAQQKIEAMKAKKEEALQRHTANKEARIEKFEANRTAKIEQRAANKEATIQAHKDANAARKAILDKNREAIKNSKTPVTTP